jgi:threonine/homoserine/homoserine lactone efflux protein
VGEALVAALGIAVSPFAIIPAILLLFSARPGSTSGAFGAGWFAGIAVVTLVAVLLGDLITLPDAAPRWATYTRIGLGALLVLVGLSKFVRRGGEAKQPAWLTTLETATPRSAARFGLIGSAANPKVALLAVAGGFALGADLHGLLQEVAAVVGFALVAASTALLPALAFAVRGERVLGPLGVAKDWLVSRIDVVMSVILVVIGLVLLTKGVTYL